MFQWPGIYRRISIRIHPLDKRYFLFFPPPPCSNDNSRFIGMHIHRSDRIPDTRQTSESRGEMAHLNDQSVVPPRKNQPLFFSSSSPPSSPRAGIMKPIFEAHRITIWIAKSWYVRIYVDIMCGEHLAGSHKFANCWSAVSAGEGDGSGSRSRLRSPGARD